MLMVAIDNVFFLCIGFIQQVWNGKSCAKNADDVCITLFVTYRTTTGRRSDTNNDPTDDKRESDDLLSLANLSSILVSKMIDA